MSAERNALKPQIVVPMLLIVVAMPLLPLLISWRWGWWEAWVWAGVSILGFAISRVLAVRRHPDLLIERAESMRHKNTKEWDKHLAPLVGFGSGLAALVAGLDKRFAWSPGFSLPVKLVSLTLILAGYLLGTWALIENRFFSGVVRIQTDRGHYVVTTGPYGWIRHPGYAGAVLVYLSTPPFLDSWWAFVPTVASAMLLVARTELEDRALQEELTGYRAYAQRVRYRLVPGVW